ncbi:MAG TPA: hypothetical protein ENK47_07255 [Euryarchaeota archaeon]|nr:hypothetical protein [Euryarchaeota archaeon]
MRIDPGLGNRHCEGPVYPSNAPVYKSGSYWGIAMGLCSNSLFKYNVIKNNDYAFWIQGSRGNTLYLNDIIGNTAAFDKVTDLGMSFTEQNNTWDNGWGKGNYWSDYQGQDTNGDWIGDTNLPHNGVDNYPLMGPYN